MSSMVLAKFHTAVASKHILQENNNKEMNKARFCIKHKVSPYFWFFRKEQERQNCPKENTQSEDEAKPRSVRRGGRDQEPRFPVQESGAYSILRRTWYYYCYSPKRRTKTRNQFRHWPRFTRHCAGNNLVARLVFDRSEPGQTSA